MKKSLSALLLALVVFAVYAPAVRNEFVWDDSALVLRDPLIRSWRLIPEGFQHFLFVDAAASDFYRPLQRLTYTVEYAAFGFWPAAYHVTNILLHATAALMLFLFSRELLQRLGAADRARRWVPFAAALAWAIHPVQSAAVVYISGRADPLAAAAGFAALYFGLLTLRAVGGRKWALTLLSGLCFLLSAFSKESGMIFLAVWVAILIFERNWRAVARAAVVAAFVFVIYFSLRLGAHHTPPPENPPVPLLVRPIVVSRAVAEYAGLIALPLNLRMERNVETQPSGFSSQSITAASWRELQTLLGLGLIAGFVYWAHRERKRDRTAFLCLVLTAITYIPISGVIVLNATVAEHWLYLPSAFLFLALALVAMRLVRVTSARGLQVTRVAAAGIAVWMLFLGGRTFARTFDWKDQRTFLERTMAAGGDSPRMLINLGVLELAAGRLDEAKRHFETALRKQPDQPLAVANLAAVAIKQNDFKSAHALLARATEMPLVAAQAQEMLAVLAQKESGKVELQRLRLASRTGPPNWAIEKRFVKVLDEVGATDRAIAELKHCLGTQWYRADTWHLLSELLAKSGRVPEAAAALQQAQLYDVRLAERLRPSG